MENQKLWTRDFTIITLGSVVSMFGNALSGFAMSLMVLDYTESTLFYAIYLASFTIPQIIMPIFSGAILDRFSRRKTIYTLDFLSSFLYLFAAFIIYRGLFSFPIFALYVFVVGSINSVYLVAYQSFYPLLITPGNFSKAYSISSVLETMSALMVPVAAFVYNSVGITPLLFLNAISFFIAAVMETQIKAQEDYIEIQKQNIQSTNSSKQFLTDIKEGFKYLKGDRGLLAIAIFFTFTSLGFGVSNVLVLPYYRSTFQNGEYIFMLVSGMSVLGRGIGGAMHYRMKIPAEKKFMIAMFVYVMTSLIEGSYFYFPILVGMVMCFITGILGVTSWTIRVSATQSYVPNEMKGRFNGAFNMLNTVGSLTGQLLAGILSLRIPPRMVVSLFMAITIISAFVVILGNKKDVALIYNRHQ